jgi:hypothetical protein
MSRLPLLHMICDGEHWIELRCRTADDRWAKHWARSALGADETAGVYARAGQDVYVGCAPRIDRTGDGQRHYAPVRVLWADCDTARASAKLELFEPSPTVIVLSGGQDEGVPNRHAYWQLEEPLPAAEARAHLQRLAHHLEADAKSAEPARVLRVPGSRHHRTGRVARLIEFTGEVHRLADLTGDLPLPATGSVMRRRRTTPSEWVQLLHEMPEGDRNSGLTRIAGHLLNRQVDEHLALGLLHAANRAACKPPLPAREVERICESILRRELRKATAA